MALDVFSICCKLLFQDCVLFTCHRMNFGTNEERELFGDSKYRNYVNQVEKALKAFEFTTEWADLISALVKLNKVNIL